VLPLREVSGPKGSIHVHLPFTVNDIQQCRQKLGKCTEDPDKFVIEFQTLALGFDLSWREFQFLLANCCTPTEREKILTATHREADEGFTRDPIGWHPGDETVPTNEPHWDYNTPGGMPRRAHVLKAILRGIKSGAKSWHNRTINFQRCTGLPTSNLNWAGQTFRQWKSLFKSPGTVTGKGQYFWKFKSTVPCQLEAARGDGPPPVSNSKKEFLEYCP
jgi:hypothetical protein